MKAAVVTRTHELEVWDVPMPEPGDYEVLCKITYGATCAGTDLRLIRGGHPRPVAYPTILGHESVGRVVAVGKKVKNFKEGDLVSRVGAPPQLQNELGSNWGGFAEYGIAKDHWEMKKDGVESVLWNANRVNQVIWPGIDEKAALLIITLRETLSYFQRLHIPRGGRVLIIGSGANALAFALHAREAECRIYVIGSEKRKSQFESIGVEQYMNYKSPCLEKIWMDTNGADVLFDAVIDAVGSSEILNQMLGFLQKNGVVGIYGWNDRAKSGICVFSAQRSFRVYADGYDEEETHGAVCKLFVSGRVDPTLWYDMKNPVQLPCISQAYEKLKRHEAIKYLIKM